MGLHADCTAGPSTTPVLRSGLHGSNTEAPPHVQVRSAQATVFARACALVNAVIMSAREVARNLRAELHALRKRVRTWRPERAAIVEPSTEMKSITVVIYSLSQDAKMPAVWAQRRQDGRRRHDRLWPVSVSQLQERTWFRDFGQDPRVPRRYVAGCRG